jgi:hypothetical protein
MPSADDLKYLQMTPQDLELTIGALLLEDTLGAKSATDAEKRSAAGEWFAANLGRFRQGVCWNQRIRKDLFGKDKQDRNLLFATVIDALTALGGFPVPVAAISAQLIHYGLDRLCVDAKGHAN